MLSATLAPLYIEYALEATLREGVGQVVREREMLLNHESRLLYAVSSAKNTGDSWEQALTGLEPFGLDCAGTEYRRRT